MTSALRLGDVVAAAARSASDIRPVTMPDGGVVIASGGNAGLAWACLGRPPAWRESDRFRPRNDAEDLVAS